MLVNSQKSQELLDLLQSKLSNQIQASCLNLGHAEVRIGRENMLDFFKLLKLDTELDFNLFLSVTVTDWMDEGEERFEVVYHLTSVRHLHRLRVKIWAPEENAKVDSVCELWSGANFMEREAWDMYGVEFVGHPDLRRILMYDEFEGFPLRKDYPIQAKQPRIPLRSPEVENTARHMKRSELVQIGSGKRASA